MFFTIKVITIQSTDKANELLSISFGMADVYTDRTEEVKTRREEIKQMTLEKRRQRHRQGVQDRLYLESESSLILAHEMSH